MNNTVAYGIIAIILIVWFYFFVKKKVYAMIFLIYSTIIIYSYTTKINIDLIIKILFLITTISSGIKYGFRRNVFIIIYLLLILFIIGFLGTHFDNTYTLESNITAYISNVIGFLIVVINWPNDEQERVFKLISFIPCTSIALGVVLLPFNLIPFFSRAGEVGVGGVSMATNLSFFSVVAIIASLSYYKKNGNSKYRVLAYVNFFILLATLTRGGILAGTIAIMPDLILWIKQTTKSLKKVIITIIIIIISAIPLNYIYELILDRSFTSKGEFSSSGRFEAWSYMIRIVNNKLVGNGLGFLKTATDKALSRGFKAAHNEYVRIYLETGYIGIFVHFLLFYFSFKLTIKSKSIISKRMIMCFILTFLVYSLTDNTITNYRFFIPYLFTFSFFRTEDKYKNLKKVNEKMLLTQ